MRNLSHTSETLTLCWPDGRENSFHAIWLRDNCCCELCGRPETGRRLSRLTDIPLDIAITSVSATDAGISIEWSDAHRSLFDSQWLYSHTYDNADLVQRVFTPTIWSDATRASPPVLDFNAVIERDSAFLEMLTAVRDVGLCFLRDAPIQAGTLVRLAEKIGPIQESNFGRVQDLMVDESRQSVANRSVALKPHTDEPYRASPPGLLLFHCIETDINGAGASLFMDGFELAEILRHEDADGFTALSRNKQSFRRYFKGDVDLMAEFPLISVDEFGHLMGIRLNDRVAAPLSIKSEQVELYYRGLKRLLELAEDPCLMLERTLQSGDVAVFDNHRILHGRTELSMKRRRWLQWLQVERGDFHSSLRITADKVGRKRDWQLLLRGAYG